LEIRGLPNEPLGAADQPQHFADRILRRMKLRNWSGDHRPLTYWAWAVAAVCAVIGSVTAVPGMSGLLGGGLAVVMIAIAASDARHFVIPDKLVLAALALGLVKISIVGGDAIVADIGSSILRAFALAAFFFGFRAIYRWIRGREGLGLGDVKLAGVAGLWLSWMAAVIAIDIATLSALAGVLIGIARGQKINRQTKVPFGLFFAPAIWAAWLLDAIVLR
jgi:leader peptidase (prepilin peptidase) / N-methyltransferase